MTTKDKVANGRLSPSDVAFREGLRRYFTSEFPRDLREKVSNGAVLSKDEIVTGHRALNSVGLAVPHWPVRWGGRGWSRLQLHLWRDEMDLAAVPPPMPFNANLVGPVLAEFASEQLQEQFLPPTANLDIWWCQGFSEPEAGSDLASLRTVAARDGDDYVVNGQKIWTTGAHHSDWMFALVRTDPNAQPRQRGISFLLIDMNSPGVDVRRIELHGSSHDVCEVFLQDVRVPRHLLVGEENRGWDYAKALLGNERVGNAVIGATKRNLRLCKIKAKECGLTIPSLWSRIAEIETELLALELTAIRVSGYSDGGSPHPASSILKMKGSELQQAVSEVMMDIAGVQGLRGGGTDYDCWLDTATDDYIGLRAASIYGGSNEIQRQIIAKDSLLLKA